MLHASQCTLWAVAYYFYPYISDLSSFDQAIYFSMITFTTICYGDVTINSEWRIMAGLEAVNGIMLIGWSTAMIFAFLQILYQQSWNTHSFGLKGLFNVSSKEEIDIHTKNESDNTI
ncbi:potassium channel family protein [Sphingobacterium paucimobilis]|uniref:Potassium channel domain-containing protein n=1 Tax=Sphingobacterium paucimobilis HER1398 TaxID=1346330 RepID=U2IXF9_9SPHI|nr:potassium channel family protein [Sphingobacterium paucimobilis]ERJ57394.1 hypothetical protein M472_01305 [Sphingobacterium paucimobilis HER1398]